MDWTVAEIASATRGTVAVGDPTAVIAGVGQDTRTLGASAMFVALVADRDGHDFVADAVTSGATAVLSSRPARDLDGLADETAVIEVPDTEAALQALGRAGRARLGAADVVGITGSVGKTTTKDLLAAVLATDRATHASHRSFNNEIGVPLTILGAANDTRALVLEMGARGIGHIATLCEIGRPTVGIVTAVAAAHTSEFGSIEGVANAKGELVEALPSGADGGIAVLNMANPHVAAMAERTEAEVVGFGTGGDVVAESVELDDDLVPRFALRSPWGNTTITLGARGVHLVDNALAAAAAALALGVAVEGVADGLSRPIPSPMRMDLRRSTIGTRVLNDAYNANPTSMTAALDSLAALPAERRIAVLGVMAELGAGSDDAHRAIAAHAANLGVRVLAVDAVAYGADVEHAADIADALEKLGPLGPDDAVLLKGSRVAGLERIAALLIDD